MLRSLTLLSLSASLVSVGCSNNDGGTGKPPVILMPDMSDNGGTGGNGGGGGTGGGGGGGTGGGQDMAVSGGGDMAPGLPDLAGLPAPDHDPTLHPPMQKMSSVSTATKIPAPEVWTVVWKGDKAAIGDKVNKFQTWMMGSTYWLDGMKEWGVTGGSAKGVLELPTAAPASIDQSQLDALIDNNMGKNGWPTKNANTIMSLVTNPKTSITSLGQPAGCVQFDGYHTISGGGVPYLVNCYCNDAAGAPDFKNLTVTISHEVGEATSDYDLQHNRVVNSSTGATFLGGGENGDMCLSVNADIKAPDGETYSVQRLYSNVNAVKNGADDPCADPFTPKLPYFGAGLWSGGSDQSLISITRTGGKGSATIKIEPFAYDAAFGPVAFYVAGSLLPTGMTLTPDIARRRDPNDATKVLGIKVWGNPGSTTNITVNVDNTFAAANVGRPQTFLIIAHNYDKSLFNVWWGTAIVKN
ncbi:MAG: hypothetical protein JWN44_1597 [Myxococcales bacterium]|nr:hypothetical protein [Myxococcales bacterium]